MNYELQIEKSNPAIFNVLNGTRPPLVAGTGSSTLLSTSTTLAFTAYSQPAEPDSFTLEAWYLPVSPSSTVVIGHTGEGVIYDGTNFTLRMKFSDSTQIEGTWTPQESQSFHVVAVYDVGSYNLYVNGDRVISLQVPAGKTFLYSGNTVTINGGTGTGIYDSAAVYYRALPEEEISQHYFMGQAVADSRDIASANSGETYRLTYDSVNIIDSFVFDNSNWDNGFLSGLSIADNMTSDGTTGYWMGSIPIGSIAGPTTAGVHVTLVGYNTAISYSLDGINWTTTPNKRTILQDATAEALYVKLDLAADSWVSSLVLDIIGTRVLSPLTGSRDLQFNGVAFDQTPGHQLDYQTDAGADIVSGYIDIIQETDLATGALVNVTAIEAWIKFNGEDGRVITASGSNYVNRTAGSLAFTGVTTYMNGTLLAAGPVASGIWNHFIFVLSTAQNSTIRIGDSMTLGSALNLSVGHVAVYTKTFDASVALDLYRQNIGAPVVRIDDASAIGVTESAPSTDIYAYRWTSIATNT